MMRSTYALVKPCNRLDRRIDASRCESSTIRLSKEAIKAIRRLERFDLQFVEQPLAAHDYAGHPDAIRCRGSDWTDVNQSPRDALTRSMLAPEISLTCMSASQVGFCAHNRSSEWRRPPESLSDRHNGRTEIASAAAVHLACVCEYSL